MHLIVPEKMDGLTLMRVLCETAPEIPHWAIKKAIQNRDVRVDGARVSSGEMRVLAGQEIRAYWPKNAIISRDEDTQSAKKLEIAYEDEHVLLVIKPQGLPSQDENDPRAGDTALTRAVARLEKAGSKTDFVRLCHRLDVQTGGLLLMTKDDAAYESAVQAFSQRTMRKFYICRVKGCPSQAEAVMHAYLRKDAELARVSVTDYPARGAAQISTAYRVLENGEFARLEVELLTGRTHQIRAHLAHIGHPILGDDKYGDRLLNRRLGLRRQQLWATRMIFKAEGALAYLNGRSFECACPF